MNFWKKHLKNFTDDSFLGLVLKLSIVGIALHLYQFINSGYSYQPLQRLIFCSLAPFVIYFAGRQGVYWYFYIFANLLALQTTFQNYTAFIIICIFIMLNPKMKFMALIIYSLEIIVVATYRDKTPVHIAIHISNCILIYYAIRFLLKPTVSKKKLDLTVDETLILEELLKGKQQKEIEQFSQNTVTNKLKAARERNGFATTEELLKKYKEQNYDS